MKCEKHGIEFDPMNGCPECIEEYKMDRKPSNIVGSEVLPPATAIINVKPELNPDITILKTQVEELVGLAEAATVSSEEDVSKATNDLSNIARLKKALSLEKDNYLNPIKHHMNDVTATFKLITVPLENADAILRSKVLGYRNEQERRAREQESIERQKRELAEREARLKGEEIKTEPPVPTVNIKQRMQSEAGESNIAKIWKWELEDFSKVPDAYKTLDNGAVPKAVKASKGAVSIPGIRIFQENTLTVGAKG
jgi:hypothetical protein